jgi:hypothetical protein
VLKVRGKGKINFIRDKACRLYSCLKNPLLNNKAVGIAEIVGVAIVLVVGAFVLIPGFREFADTVMDAITAWWTNTISTRIFPTS